MSRWNAAFVLLALVAVACGPTPSVASTRAPSPIIPTPSREPSTLPELPWERQIVDGLRAQGIELSLVGGSKFESYLGPRLPARVFIVRPGAGGEGADVLFLEQPIGDITVCTTQQDPSRNYWTYTLSIDGRVVSRGEGTQYMLYSVSDEFFVQAVGERLDGAIRKVLGTSRARC